MTVTEYHDPERKQNSHARLYGGGRGKEGRNGGGRKEGRKEGGREGRRVGNTVGNNKKYT